MDRFMMVVIAICFAFMVFILYTCIVYLTGNTGQ